jgi:hypothetical protein
LVRRLKFALAGALLATGIAAGGAAANGPLAHAAGSCGMGNTRGYGYSYLTSLWEKNTTCKLARTIAKDHGHYSGWSCKKTTLDSSPVQYDARVTCTSGSRVVKYTYTENR